MPSHDDTTASTSSLYTPRRGTHLLAATAQQKTARTLFMERHHEKLQREARADDMLGFMLANPVYQPEGRRATSPATPTRFNFHSTASHVLFNDRDNHRWGGIHSGDSDSEEDSVCSY